MKNRMQCKNHPERIAKRRCYQCKAPICAQCQNLLDHHIFCSTECHQKWLKAQSAKKNQPEKPKAKPKTEQRLSELEDTLERTLTRYFQMEKKLRTLEQGQNKNQPKNFLPLILIPLLAVGLVLGMFIYLAQWRKALLTKAMSKENPTLSQFASEYPVSIAEHHYLEAPILELAPGAQKISGGKINLYGKAPGAEKLTLLINGREKETIRLNSMEFIFSQVQLIQGNNLIQLLAQDKDGNQAYSIAQLVNYSGQNQMQVFYTPGLDYIRGSRDKPFLALTFDAGGEASYAKRVLEILKERRIKTTIFLTGQFIEQYPNLVRQMVEDGHEIGNHTYSHPHLTTWEQNHRQWTKPEVTREFLQKELLTTAQLFQEVSGAEMAPLWRAPYGEHNWEIRRWAEEAGFYHINWSRDPGINYDTLDWLCDENAKHYRSPQEIRALLTELSTNKSHSANGAIILMHLSTERGKKFPDQVLAPALDALTANGYKIVTVSELFPALMPKVPK